MHAGELNKGESSLLDDQPASPPPPLPFKASSLWHTHAHHTSPPPPKHTCITEVACTGSCCLNCIICQEVLVVFPQECHHLQVDVGGGPGAVETEGAGGGTVGLGGGGGGHNHMVSLWYVTVVCHCGVPLWCVTWWWRQLGAL